MNSVNDLAGHIRYCFWSTNVRLLSDQVFQRHNKYGSASFRYRSAQDEVMDIPCDSLLAGKILHLDAMTSRFSCFVIVKRGAPTLYLSHPGLWQRIFYRCKCYQLIIHVDSAQTVMEMIPAKGQFVFRNSKKNLVLDDDQTQDLLRAIKL